VLIDLQERLGLLRTETDSACGEVESYPTTMTALGGDPLSLMFAFWTAARDEPPLSLSPRLREFVETDAAQVSFEDGFAWLSLYDLSGETGESIQQLLAEFTAALAAAGLPAPMGCAACGNEESAELRVLEGRAVRICPGCAGSLYEQRQLREEELNRPAAWHGLALPMACFYVAAGWAGFWLLTDVVLGWLGGVIWINAVTVMLGIAILAGIGFALGIPIGWVVRRSGLAQLSPVVVSALVVGLSALLGEILFIAVSVFLRFDVFNVNLAARLLLPFVQTYPLGWIVAKLLTAGAIAFGCHSAAIERRTVSLSSLGVEAEPRGEA